MKRTHILLFINQFASLIEQDVAIELTQLTQLINY